MAIVKKVDKKVKVGIDETIKYQILTYCFFKKIQISNSDLMFLAELAKNDGIELTRFCSLLADKKIFKTTQSARNAVTKAEKKTLIIKNGASRKTVSISDKINVQTKGLVLLDFKILGDESKEA
jgi:hypothetical protein